MVAIAQAASRATSDSCASRRSARPIGASWNKPCRGRPPDAPLTRTAGGRLAGSSPHLMKTAPLLLAVSALMLAACQSEPPRSAIVPPPPTGILSSRQVDKPPQPLRDLPPPRYPANLRRNNISGQAVVRFIVTHDGRVIDVTVIEATHPQFGDAAAAAVEKWKFAPAIKDGQPIACLLTVPIVFNLNSHPRR